MNGDFFHQKLYIMAKNDRLRLDKTVICLFEDNAQIDN